MPELHSEYRELFCLQTFQRGRPMAFALSPTGRWICSASDYGDLLIQRSTRGYVYCHVGMGRLYHVTAITWATDFQIILGCFNGAVYVATLTLNPNENQIKITHLLDDVVSPVRALAYDIDQKLLALGYRGRVSVWRRSVGKDRARAWKTVDIFRTSIGDLPAKIPVQSGHCTRALAADKDMLYASYTSAIGFTTIVTYCNNDARRKSLKEKHDLHPESGRDTHFYPFHKVYKSPKKQAHTTIKYLHK
ncbi:hypothetical protein FRC06_004924, partial [Ceratobasidium sp. 370]